MTSVSPIAIGIGAGALTAGALGFGAYKIMDGIGNDHPNGSEADGSARVVKYGLVGLGIAAGVGGFFMGGRGFGTSPLGAALIGGGVGAAIGGLAAGWGFERKHGVGVETSVNDVLSSYDRNNNDRIDMDNGSWWRSPETQRTVTNSHTDSNGNTWYDTDTYSIERLSGRADEDRDWKVTRGELTKLVGSYDLDGNGRLQKDELSRYKHEVGEQFLG